MHTAGSHVPPPPLHVPLMHVCPDGQSVSLQHADEHTHEYPLGMYPALHATSHKPCAVHVGDPFCTAAQGLHVWEVKQPLAGVLPVQMPEHECSGALHVGPPELLLEPPPDELLLDEPPELLEDIEPLDELVDELVEDIEPLDELLPVMSLPPSPLEEPPAPPSPPTPSPGSNPGPVGVAQAPTNPRTNAAKPSFPALTLASVHVRVRMEIFARSSGKENNSFIFEVGNSACSPVVPDATRRTDPERARW